MHMRRGPCLATFAAMFLLACPLWSQDDGPRRKAASHDGTTGLFRAWDAETLRRGEANFSIGWSHYNRDPGELRFQTIPLGFAVGLHDRFEVFGSFDVLKRIDAPGIRPYRVLPGRLPVVAWSPLGAASFTNEAPFMDVPSTNEIGDLRLGAKWNLFSERRGDPLGVSAVGFVKIPVTNSRTQLNRGLGSGEPEGSWGVLFSRSAGRIARLHLNTMVNWVGDPVDEGIELADLQDEFWYRAGASFFVHRKAELIGEVEGRTYFGSRTLGLNPASPVDVIVGLRLYPTRWLALGAGYRLTGNRIEEQPARRVFPTGIHGMVAQLTFGRRANDPPTVTCAASESTIRQDQTTTIRAIASDPDGDALSYTWSASGGRLTPANGTATFDATGLAPGTYSVTVTVSDGKRETVCTVEITVIRKNLPPEVRCEPASATVAPGESTTVRAVATDPNNDPLTWSWTINGQRVAADGPELVFGSTGRQPGAYTVTATVSDGELTASCTSTITVQAPPNRPPTIECLTPAVEVESGRTVELRVRAADPDGDPTTVTWSATGGSIRGSGTTVNFDAAGLRAGIFTVTAAVEDGRGGRASCTITVSVRERIVLSGFAPGRYRVDNLMKAALDDIAVRMRDEPRLRARIVGYTDSVRGGPRDLGRRRAQAVADYLKGKGVDSSRLTVVDGGDSNPIGDNRTPEGRKQNRRVEIELFVQ